VDGIMSEAAKEIMEGFDGKILGSTERYKYFADRIERVAKKTANMAVEHVKRGGFTPSASEMAFGEGKSMPPIIIETIGGETIRLEGRIDRIDVKSDPATNTFGVEILIDNKDLVLKAGLSARVYLTTKVLSNVILIPQSAVLFRENRTEVFVVEADQTAQPRAVQLGQTQSNIIQVLTGLTKGDRLIVRGQNYVKAGAKVTFNNVQ